MTQKTKEVKAREYNFTVFQGDNFNVEDYTLHTDALAGFAAFLHKFTRPEKNSDYFVRGRCSYRNDESMESIDWIIIDGDGSLNDPKSAPDPKQVHEVMKKLGINHILYPSFSNIISAGKDKKTRWRLVVPITGIDPDKYQLRTAVDQLIKMLQDADVPVRPVRENNIFSQAWYLTGPQDTKNRYEPLFFDSGNDMAFVPGIYPIKGADPKRDGSGYDGDLDEKGYVVHRDYQTIEEARADIEGAVIYYSPLLHMTMGMALRGDGANEITQACLDALRKGKKARPGQDMKCLDRMYKAIPNLVVTAKKKADAVHNRLGGDREEFGMGKDNRYLKEDNCITRLLKQQEEEKEEHDRILAHEVRELLPLLGDRFTYRDVYQHLSLTEPGDKHNVRVIFGRLEKAGFIVNEGSHWEMAEDGFSKMDMEKEPGPEIKIPLPFGLNNNVVIRSGNVILIVGDTNAGKTGIALSICANCFKGEEVLPFAGKKINYLNSENSEDELIDRIKDSIEPDVKEWLKYVDFNHCHKNFARRIDPDGLNVVDYLELHDEFWKCGKIIAEINRALKNGIAIVLLQKKEGFVDAKGGAMTREKARLSININIHAHNGRSVKIMKLKGQRKGSAKIEGYSRPFYWEENGTPIALAEWKYVKELEKKAEYPGFTKGLQMTDLPK